MRAYIGPAPRRAPILPRTIDDSDDRACLQARHADHLAYELNRRSDHATAYAHWKQALPDAATWALARS